MRRYLVTGGAGFIGSNFIRYVFEHEPDAHVTNLDALTYAGVRATVDELEGLGAHTFVHGDITDPELVESVMPGHDVVVHFAAESHVDRSITGAAVFLETNVLGTNVLLDAARRNEVPRFLQVSTDEVYGSIASGAADEHAPLNPSSPYSASKAAGDLLASSYAVTYGYEPIITRCTNNYGPYQFPEKALPVFILSLLQERKLPVYGDGMNERDWLFVEDHCSALHLLVEQGTPGEIYNIGADAQVKNIDLARSIVAAMGATEESISFVPDRLGHDFRYAVDSSKIRALGWKPAHSIEERLATTIAWYTDREDWWRPLIEAGR